MHFMPGKPAIASFVAQTGKINPQLYRENLPKICPA
jgi:hypothetical protein